MKAHFFLILPWLKKTMFDDLAERSFMSPSEGVRRVRLPKCYVLIGVRHFVWKRWRHQLDPAAKKCIAQPLNFYINVKLSLYSIYLPLRGWKWLKHSKAVRGVSTLLTLWWRCHLVCAMLRLGQFPKRVTNNRNPVHAVFFKNVPVKLEAWGPFLGRPGNLTGLKPYLKIKI